MRMRSKKGTPSSLLPGQSISHLHRTVHLQGDRATLDRVARAVLGVALEEIEGALAQ